MFAFFSALCLYGKSTHDVVVAAMMDVDAEYHHLFFTLVHVIRTERGRKITRNFLKDDSR